MKAEAIAAIMVSCLVVGLLVGMALGFSGSQVAAIKAGVAEWRIDPKTGDKSFHYLKP